MTWFVDSATVPNRALGACDSQAHESAVAEVGLMLTASARTAAVRVGEAWSLCTRLPATLAALETGRITLGKARAIDAETLNLSDAHTVAVEQQVLTKARQQIPGQLRAATRRAVLATDPAAAQRRPNEPAVSVGCRCGLRLRGWRPCAPISPPPMPSACSPYSTTTPATPDSPGMSAAWTPAALTP